MFRRSHISKSIYEPTHLTEREKINYLAQMKRGEIFPDAYRHESEITLLALLARRVIELEMKVDEHRRHE